MLALVETGALGATIVLLLTGGLAITAAHFLRFNPIIGFFIAGAVIGPQALGLAQPGHGMDLLAEIGVAFLLFDIGLHLSFKQASKSRRELLSLAPAQVLGSTLIFALLARLFGIGWLPAFIIGAGLALSSTAVVAQLLQEKKVESSPLGRSAIAILVGQDIFVIFLLVLLPAFAENLEMVPKAIGLTLVNVALALGAVFLIGRYLLQPVFSYITRSGRDDLFTISALLFVLSVSWGVTQLGLSIGLGAFLAGMTLSESKFAHLVRGEISPFRTLLLSLFFIMVGAKLDLAAIAAAPHIVLALAAGLVAVKLAVLWIAARMNGGCNGFAARLSMTLSQGSEFGLILFPLAVSLNLLPADKVALLAPAIVLTMALTPLLASLGDRLARRIETAACPEGGEAPRPRANDGKVVIVGFEAPSERIAYLLDAAGIPYIGYEMRREVTADARARGFDVHFASPERPRVTRHTLRGEALAVVNLVPDAAIWMIVNRIIKRVSPDVAIYAAHPDHAAYDEASDLHLAELVLLNEFGETVLQRALLESLGVTPDTVNILVEGVDASPDLEPVIPVEEPHDDS